MTVRSRCRRVVVLAAASILLVAAPASAHPFFRGGEVPVDSLATLTLDLAHGCDSEEAGAGEDTTDVALQVPAWMRIVEVPEPEGWAVELERSADDETVVEVVSWTTDDPQEPAPAFDLEVVVAGEPGEERYLGVFQACGDVVYRWVGTPEEPADDPAVRLLLVEADPDAPPPPEPEPEAAPDEPVDDADAGAAADAPTDGADEPAADDGEDEVAQAAEDAAEVDDAAAATSGNDGGVPLGVILAVVAAVAAVAAFVALRGRSRDGVTDGRGQ